MTKSEPVGITADVDKVGHALVIKIPLELLAHAAERAPFAHSLIPNEGEGHFTVENPVLFARSVASRLLAERGDDGGLIHQALDDAIEDVVESDLPGWSWPQPRHLRRPRRGPNDRRALRGHAALRDARAGRARALHPADAALAARGGGQPAPHAQAQYGDEASRQPAGPHLHFPAARPSSSRPSTTSRTWPSCRAAASRWSSPTSTATFSPQQMKFVDQLRANLRAGKIPVPLRPAGEPRRPRPPVHQGALHRPHGPARGRHARRPA
jgi:hypothetical protein